ncbi:FAD-binding and (Fe-S)-binding domain-containing protein [Nitrosococcus watsonii]|uniref:FAD linked oxidase domain protein n=1 Tax=Nitrosococcus watsoni (strain C-113) TaxID=105559 RepID=D8K6R6_NITWC|nr:FAD-binding and (Fe-S)-binding domain-containing protein [Nitrosococcus watsonii]ADJ28593.1 FAD linked oxidase domain protein [Nitrosococcus watsonii C-113]
MPPATFDYLLQELSRAIQGEVLTDRLSRMLYATDASPYQQLPLGVVRPRSVEDCVTLIRFANSHRIALIPRAAGTSLAGQCVGEGLVVDVSQHWTKVLEIDAPRRWARVQPGVVLDVLNQQLRPSGLMFAPDPSTGSRCQIGGMMGNNAWGLHGLHYGTTRDHVLEVKAVLSDGSIVRFGPLNPGELDIKLTQDSLEGNLYRAVVEAVAEQRKIILERYPSSRGIPCNQGYPLDLLAQGQPWVSQGRLFNLAPFLCGSEGTLALVTEATLKLVPLPGERILVTAHFNSLDEALRAVAGILAHQPVAVELLDKTIIGLAQNNPEQVKNCSWIIDDPVAILLIELEEKGDPLQGRGEALVADLRTSHGCYAAPVLAFPEQAWAVRRAGLGLLMGMPGRHKAVTGIEDTAVAVRDLPAYVARVQTLMARYGVHCVIYGSAGRGLLHLRPALDLTLAEERERFCAIMVEMAELVKEFGGAFSAKHGDGRLRAPFLEAVLGPEIVALLSRIKQAADPRSCFNPGKILAPPPLLESLRTQKEAPIESSLTFFDWRKDQGLQGAAARCNGAGVCLKQAGQGTMCPSYMAAGEELHGTRGRANVFRQVLALSGGLTGENSPLLKEALDLCLACKGCKTECPAGVDMALMKAEFLQQYQDRHGVPWRGRILSQFQHLARLGSWLPAVANWILASKLLQRVLKFHPQRQLPLLARRTFSSQLRTRLPHIHTGPRGEVVLINDLWTEFFDPQIGMAAVSCLEQLGYKIIVTPWLSAGRIQISQGQLRLARNLLEEAVVRLYPHAAEGKPLIGLEPSELLTFRDEALALLPRGESRRKAEVVAGKAQLFEEFIAQEAAAGQLNPSFFDSQPRRILVHGHCHGKALSGMQPLLDALALMEGTTVESIPSGCCGMAGAFGYEQEHYEVSLRIGELVLFPSVRQASAGTLICAPGTSCRAQIKEGTKVLAYHPAELLQKSLL